MTKSVLWLIGLAVAAAVVPVVAAPVPKAEAKKWTDEEVTKRLFATCWYEVEKTVDGKPWPGHNYSPFGWKFGEKATECWELGGELSTSETTGGVVVDVSSDPWRLDVLSKDEKGKVSVLPGVIKFDGDDLVWATEFPGEGWYSVVDAKGEYKGRPTGFESTAANRLCVCRLKPCTYLQTVFPDK